LFLLLPDSQVLAARLLFPTSKPFILMSLEYDATTGAAHSMNNAVADRPRLTVPSLRNEHRHRPCDEVDQIRTGQPTIRHIRAYETQHQCSLTT